MHNREELKRITAAYLNDTINYVDLMTTTTELKSLLKNITGSDLNTDEGREHITCDNGIAIGTYWAALCIDDFMRTRQFVRGVHEAMKEKMSLQNDTIHIMYAGTGPFATLVLPLIFLYPKERFKYTFMEINKNTFDILTTVIKGLGLDEYHIDFVLADASTYVINKSDIPDIIISETMQNALANEQQVPIFLNLMNQAKADTIFIPEKINIYIALKQAGTPLLELTKQHYRKLEKVLEVSKDTLASLVASSDEPIEEQRFCEKHTTIAKQEQVGYKDLVLLTEIQTYKHEVLQILDSGLTLPHRMHYEVDAAIQTTTIHSYYKLGEKPKLVYEVTQQ